MNSKEFSVCADVQDRLEVITAISKEEKMEGKIKWFSNEKGFGFLVGNDSEERFFSVRDVQGVDLPSNGDTVNFQPTKGRKGPKATSVKIIKKGGENFEGRAICSSCGKSMIPRVITGRPIIHAQGGWTPVPKKSVCPFCGKLHKKFPPSAGEIIKLTIFLVTVLVVANVIF